MTMDDHKSRFGPAAWREALYKMALEGARRRLRPTRNEARAILDVHNGLLITVGILGQHLRADTADAIELNGLDAKWELDGRGFVKRLRELTLVESAAIEIWASDFWEGEYNDDKWTEQHLMLLLHI
jgi:hypothetical protein